MFDVGVVGRNVGNEVRVASLLVGVDVGLFLKSVGFGCTLVVDVPKVGVGASLEFGGCRGGMSVGLDAVLN